MRAWSPCYRACLARKRPTYSISMVQDADGKDVSYERLLLPFGSADHVEQIVGSYKAISIEGGFKINNLMGIRPKAVPVEHRQGRHRSRHRSRPDARPRVGRHHRTGLASVCRAISPDGATSLA